MNGRWLDTLDVSEHWYAEDETVAMRATAATVSRYVNEKFDDDDDIVALAEELVDAAEEGDVNWFNAVWHYVYDWADRDRIWIKTF